MWALGRRRVQLAGAETREEALRRVAAATPVQGWVLGQGWDANRWDDAPDRAALDAVQPGPVYLDSLDVHAAWVNSAALAVAGINASDTGSLRRAHRAGRRRGADRPPARARRRADDPHPARAARGACWMRPWATRRRRRTASGSPAFMTSRETPCWRLSTGWRKPTGFGYASCFIRLWPRSRRWFSGASGVAAAASGSGSGASSCFWTEAWGAAPPGCSSRTRAPPIAGCRSRARQEAALAIRLAATAGIAATVHAIGDAAVRRALDLLTAVPRAAVPHRIEHFQCVSRPTWDARPAPASSHPCSPPTC